MTTRLSVFAISILLFLAFVPAATAGEAERTTALADLQAAEETVYVGNAGSIGLSPGHPSILFRLLDAKAKNDNSLIGSTDTLIAELAEVGQSVSGLVVEDGDFDLVQVESEVVTGFTFTERLTLLAANLQAVQVLLDGAGINNEDQKQLAIARTAEAIANVELVIVLVESHLSP